MATNMSDEVKDLPVKFKCCPCSKGNTIVESLNYCDNCGEFLCGPCLSYHNRLSLTSGHKVHGISPVLVPKDSATTLAIQWKPSDDKTREINGMCTLKRGDHCLLITTEWCTQRIMAVDLNSNKCVDTLRTKSKPYGVNYLPVSGMLVVTLCDSGEVAIIGLSNKLKLKIKKYVKVSKYCRGLYVVPGFFSDSLVVVSGEEAKMNIVDVYAVLTESVELYRLKTFSLQAIHREAPLFPFNITVDANRHKLYITDKKVGAVILDTNGKRLGVLTDPCLEGACAICTDGDGNVYVSGIESENIVKFDCNGKFIGEVVNKSHGLKCPISMCFDNTTKRLVIGSTNDAHVLRIVKL